MARVNVQRQAAGELAPGQRWYVVRDTFRWQEEAIAAWEAAHHRGIVEAMTATGKTLVAIKAIRKLIQEGHKVSPLIVVPTIALLNQWYEKLLEQFPGERIWADRWWLER